MQKTKKQHYIPRAAYLRRFSDTHYDDDKQNHLIVYDKIKKISYRSNVYYCGFENFLYETDTLPPNCIENILSEFDGVYVPLLDKIENICGSNSNENALVLHNAIEKSNLKFFTLLQYRRTSKIKRLCDEMEDTPDLFIYGLTGRTSDGQISINDDHAKMKNDIIVFERNMSNTPFVLSDHPILSYHVNMDSYGTMNYRFPLTPWLQIFVISPRSYEYNIQWPYRNRIKFISNVAHVNKWNEHSFQKSNRAIYLTPGYDFNLNEGDSDFLTIKQKD
ncbi:MAG: hypothetical protein BWY11_02435 [Firmicutes bacterium ADurb.Bin182]|nr:MAG: hypothetical protein BWY11_02435 [Firmicutes bacterium ADurb.Bin182]